MDKDYEELSPREGEPPLFRCRRCATVLSNRGMHDRYHTLCDPAHE